MVTTNCNLDLCTYNFGVKKTVSQLFLESIVISLKVTCLGTCNEDTEPHSVEECHAPEPCTQEWLTGRWTVCSHSCGQGVQSRSVECVVNGPNGKLVTNDQGCSDKRKPKTQRQPSALNYDLLSIFDKSPVKDANSREAIS